MKKVIYILLILLISLFTYGCSDNNITDFEVKYEITGTDIIDITYYDLDGNEVRIEDVSLPWSYSFVGKKGNTVLIKYTRDTYNELIISRILVNNEIREEFIDKPEDVYLLVSIWDQI